MRNLLNLTTGLLQLIWVVAYLGCNYTFAGELTRIVMTDYRTIIATDVLQSDDEVTFVNIVTRSEEKLDRTVIKEMTSPITTDDAAQVVGLPNLLSWKAHAVAKQIALTGKIAKITPQLIYSTLGQSSGVNVGSKLLVYRPKDEITDPDTGKTIAYEKAKIAELEVVEVDDQYSKAKLLGSFEVEVEVGDEVQQSSALRIAVCPIQNQDGSITSAGNSLSEEINNRLVDAGITVVERSALSSALEELLVQSNALIDQDTTVKLGKLAGANVVVVGRIVPKKNSGRVFVRFIDVATGKVIFSASSTIDLRNSQVILNSPVFSDSVEKKTANQPVVTAFRGNYESGKLSNATSIQIEQKVGRNYSLTAKFNKTDSDAVIFMLPISDTNVQAVLDQEFGKMSGLSLVNGSDASHNPTRSDETTSKGANTVQITVRSIRDRASISVVLNGKEIITWQGKTSELSSKSPWIPPDRSKIGIATTNCSIELISIELSNL